MNRRFEFPREIHAFTLLLQGSYSPTITNDLLYKSLSDIGMHFSRSPYSKTNRK